MNTKQAYDLGIRLALSEHGLEKLAVGAPAPQLGVAGAGVGGGFGGLGGPLNSSASMGQSMNTPIQPPVQQPIRIPAGPTVATQQRVNTNMNADWNKQFSPGSPKAPPVKVPGTQASAVTASAPK